MGASPRNRSPANRPWSNLGSVPTFSFRRHRITPRSILLASLFSIAIYLIFSPPADNNPSSPETITGSYTRRAWDLVGGISDPIIQEGLRFDDNGLVKGWDGIHQFAEEGRLSKRDKKALRSLKDTHPIDRLVNTGLEKWYALLAR